MAFEPRWLILGWIIFVALVIALALYRKFIGNRQDLHIHFNKGEAPLAINQSAHAQQIDRVDRLGATLTVLAFASGLLIAAWYAYLAWGESARTMWSD